MRNKISALLLVLLMPLTTFAETYTYTYPSPVDSTVIYEACDYEDSYFDQSSTDFSLELCQASMGIALSTFGKTPNRIKSFMDDLGFSDIEWNQDYNTQPGRDSIGIIAGRKQIEGSTLIVMSFRGAFYEAEWASNFTSGVKGKHQGFNKAAKDALAFLDEYMQGVTGDVKFWITGYSRAAACANLLAAKLDNRYGNSNIYCYTFETPSGAIRRDNPKDTLYSNIFNLVNPSDPVTYVAPTALGFARYGVDMYYPSAETCENFASLEKDVMTFDDYCIDQFKAVNANYSQSYFLSQYIPKVTKGVLKSRLHYVVNYQDLLRDVLAAVEGELEGDPSEILLPYLEDRILGRMDRLKELLLSDDSDDQLEGRQCLAKMLNDAYRKAGIVHKELKAASKEVKFLAEALTFALQDVASFTTLLTNIDPIKCGHYPQIALCWLKYMDENDQLLFTSGDYYFIKTCKGPKIIFDKSKVKGTVYRYDAYTGTNKKEAIN
ncbi:MAG: hypothetical protein MJ146_04655 [Clostridia bacterium]|nr:hypothetical protein [Clostridia bacterium]